MKVGTVGWGLWGLIQREPPPPKGKMSKEAPQYPPHPFSFFSRVNDEILLVVSFSPVAISELPILAMRARTFLLTYRLLPFPLLGLPSSVCYPRLHRWENGKRPGDRRADKQHGKGHGKCVRLCILPPPTCLPGWECFFCLLPHSPVPRCRGRCAHSYASNVDASIDLEAPHWSLRGMHAPAGRSCQHNAVKR